jgi:hypothetical protein
MEDPVPEVPLVPEEPEDPLVPEVPEDPDEPEVPEDPDSKISTLEKSFNLSSEVGAGLSEDIVRVVPDIV